MIKVYHATSVALLGLVPAAFVLSPSMLSVPVDYSLGVLIPVHAHIGMNNVISDYVAKPNQPLARLAWLGVTGIMFLGILRNNIEGPGLTETIKTIWRESPNKKHE
jgi:succinate dehydrogenase (ubiquinone) membrane anchor subunit